jgi:TolB-like protein
MRDAEGFVDLAREAPFRVGALDVRPSTREVMLGDRRAILEPRVMQVLVALARRDREVVPRDELMTACWGDRIVGEDAINRAIAGVRRVAAAYGGFSVETVARVGHRLVVAELGQDEMGARKPSVAVLPFVNLSNDPEQDYLADGVMEEVATALTRSPWLLVMASGSTGNLKGSTLSSAAMGRQLGVRYVLEGAFQRAGDRVRVTVKLVDAQDGSQVWAERFDDTGQDVFALQDRVAASVARALEPGGRRSDARRKTSNG